MSGATFNYTELAKRVVDVVRPDFPNDTIDTSEGYQGRVHLKLVSRFFNGKSEPEKQDYIWRLLRDRLGADAEAVSLALVYGTDEL